MQKLTLVFIFITLVFACKKNTETNSPNISPVNTELSVYKNAINSNDELISTYHDANKSSTSYIYGSTDNEGRGTVAKSVVYKVKGSDTLINIILDTDLRPSILYVSTNTGVKVNQLFKFEYLGGDSIKVSFYKYNWLNNKDSLMAQYITKNNNGKLLYGGRTITTSTDTDAWFTAAGAAVVFIAVICPIAAGLIVGIALEAGPVAAAFTILGTHLLFWRGTAHAATLSTSIPIAPVSPTANITIIPNPTGTPQNPMGNSSPAVLTTNTVNSITSSTASSGGNILNDGGSPITARGVCWGTLPNPTFANPHTIDGTGIGGFTSNISGLTANAIYYVRAYATNINGIAYGNEVTFKSIQSSISDTVKIGSQIWSVKNYNVTTYRNGDPIPQVTDPGQWSRLTTGAWCYYNNDPSNGAIYGKLYNWYAVNDPRGLAPPGWHVPTNTEWQTLISFLGGEDVSGGKMKAVSSLWQSPNSGATNSSGFTGIPGGENYVGSNAALGSDYFALGYNTYWWSSTEGTNCDPRAYKNGCAGSCRLDNSTTSAVIAYQDKPSGYSVRFVKD